MSDFVLSEDGGDLVTEGGGDRVLWSSSGQYIGVIDDFRILSRVPTDAEALSAARREFDGDEAAAGTTLCYLKFSEGTGTDAFDSSGNGHDAELVGTTQWVGFEGTPDLAGTRKPLSWGVRRMRKGVMVDAQRLVFQLHKGQTQQITPLENGLDSLTYDGDFENIYDWTSVAGHYATQLSRGLVRLHELGDGVTYAFDVLGDVDPDRGYTDVGPEIMRNVATRQGKIDDVEGVDTGAILAAAEARPDAMGYSTGGASVTILSVLNEIAGHHDGWWTLLRDGRFTVGLRQVPGVPEFELGVDDLVLDGLEAQAESLVVRQWTLSYAPFEVTLDLESVAGAIPMQERSRYTKDRLYASSPDLGDADFLKRFPDARFATADTLYDTVQACRRECERRAAIDQYPWQVYKAPLVRGIFQYRAGQSCWLVYDRFNLEDGNGYVVGGQDETAETESATLMLWGRKL